MSWLSGLLGPSKPETLESLFAKVQADSIGFGHIRIQDWVRFLQGVVTGPTRVSIEGAIRPDILSTYTPEKIASELRFLQLQRAEFLRLDLGIYPHLDPTNTEIAKKIRAAVIALFDEALKQLMVAARAKPAPPVVTDGQKTAASYAARLAALGRGGKRKTKKRKQSKRKRRHTRK
jgi:hypothetical protein